MNNLSIVNSLITLSFFLSTVLPVLSLDTPSETTKSNTLVPENTDTKSEFNPKPASASLYNLGLKSYEQGDIKSAVSFFKRAVDLDPEFIDAYYNLGAIYKKQKNFPQAIDSFQKAYNLNHEDHEVIFELASCYFEEKSYQNAKKYFSLLPTTFPKYNEAVQKIGLITQSFGSTESTTNSPDQAASSTANPKSQAQLLADTLGKAEGRIEQETSTENTNSQPPPNQAELLVNNLTKPSASNISPPIKVITGNFHGPTGIAKDSKNNIYIGNFGNDRIERISSNGKRETFLEHNGIKGPVGIAVDSNDNVYVANYNGDSIIRITPDKEVSIISSKVIKPYYLLYDSFSNKLFATIQGNDSLVEINTNSTSKQPITAR